LSVHELVDLRSLIETHQRPFVVIGADHRVVAVNRAFEQAFDLPDAVIVGLPCHRVLHGRDQPCDLAGEDCPLRQCLDNEQPSSCLHTHRDASGGDRRVRVDMYPIRRADGRCDVGAAMSEIGAGDGREQTKAPRGLRLVGRSRAFLASMAQLEQAARSHAPVLIVGETGTGKELAARYIHRHSNRNGRPFVAIDCAVIAEALFESELFGHERGAFTGSLCARPGLFEVAENGTVFLDEIGEVSPVAQAKLLRVLEAREFRRVGGNRFRTTAAAVVCATNRDLWQRVEEGRFREDLYYRVAGFRVRMPPLRARMEDVPLLAEELLHRIGHGQSAAYRLDRAALTLLMAYDYPGNVRELRNVLQVAVANLGPGQRGSIGADAVAAGLAMRGPVSVPPRPPSTATALDGHWQWPSLAQAGTSAEHPPPGAGTRVTAPLRDLEAAYIAGHLRRCGGNRRRAAAALGISERTLYRKLAKYGLGEG
jgi:two-component system, NtrC family, response regulator AtoC